MRDRVLTTPTPPQPAITSECGYCRGVSRTGEQISVYDALEHPGFYLDGSSMWQVFCDTCECRGPRALSRAEAIAKWNHRPGEERLRAVLRRGLALLQGQQREFRDAAKEALGDE